MDFFQGDIVLADLNPIRGHEQAGVRPVLIMQNNILNKHLNTIIVAPITSSTSLRGTFTTFFLPKKQSGLSLDSLILLFQLRAIDSRRIVKKISSLHPHSLIEVKKQLVLVF